ncbi:ABC transporter [Candidatus Rickettsiella isopodorum]|jgi:ABC-2 type transport system ATP-binding protein|uniref:ABC transporter n=1 Tax=Candidatus Rickettsiella isopodorum TaxID=1225476 RepID=A0A1J8PDS3_9COXI|nr:ABC transporter ATP-binding protein [Candidatus Rickettsiella isopodorum]MCH9637271.1 ABC transporter ATP-binding protein [Gammaproteobacteria bacterium]MDQ5900217.1 type transport system ATP-binding protein [Pseudomonadota bacterium]MCH9755515.1 ABC transporter ATP-binding protein [Gammaproteobacteria bacterium]MDD5162350.1 ABC transporter ATP-binding protein [Candidatus Rickettsiella isopodorum]OIZ95487.1 ABC transporter [Candidatus Rickettsiella isopodorum]
MQALSIQGLRKIYKNGVVALKNIDLTVEEGDFFALLGPNGAGKSTTIGIIASLINKTAGTVKIFGHSIDNELESAKSCIGIVPQELNFSIFEKVIDVIVYQAGYYGVPRRLAKQRAERYLKKLDLWDKRNQISMQLSGGMKRRLMIARALVHQPRLLILDEPTAGVDIEIRRSMWEFLRSINQQGITIILTTHYLEEAEYLCKNIAIIDKGSIIENTSMKQLLATLNMETFVFDLKKPLVELPQSPFGMRLLDNVTLEVDVAKEQSLNNLFGFLEGHHIEVTSLRNKANRLEELFLNLIAANKNK